MKELKWETTLKGLKLLFSSKQVRELNDFLAWFIAVHKMLMDDKVASLDSKTNPNKSNGYAKHSDKLKRKGSCLLPLYKQLDCISYSKR